MKVKGLLRLVVRPRATIRLIQQVLVWKGVESLALHPHNRAATSLGHYLYAEANATGHREDFLTAFRSHIEEVPFHQRTSWLRALYYRQAGSPAANDSPKEVSNENASLR